jgi:queuine tRNA-ribosyltransferase
MLGWVLLQIHNHHVIDRFFAAIRESIRNGTFDSDMAAFERRYESQLPSKTGQGPRYKYLRHAAKLMADDGDRARGYQYKSEGPGELKKNQAAYKRLENGEEELVEATLPRANGNAKDV